MNIGHWIKTIVLGLASNGFDVFTDVGTGLHHYHPKNVTRFFGNFTAIADNCVPHPDVNVTGKFECLEKDLTWAVATFMCIHLPSLAGALHLALPALSYGWAHGFDELRAKPKRVLLVALLLLLLPFPILVFAQQVTSLFIVNPQMELLECIFPLR